MKKLLVLSLSVVMSLSLLASCGNKEPKSTQSANPSETSVTSSENNTSSTSDKETETGKNSKELEKYVSLINSQKAAIEQSTGGTATFEVTAVDGVLICNFILKDQQEITEEMKTYLSTSIDALEPEFVAMLDEMESNGIKSPKIKVGFSNADGTEIASKDISK